jgi:hypothetical protein
MILKDASLIKQLDENSLVESPKKGFSINHSTDAG